MIRYLPIAAGRLASPAAPGSQENPRSVAGSEVFVSGDSAAGQGAVASEPSARPLAVTGSYAGSRAVEAARTEWAASRRSKPTSAWNRARRSRHFEQSARCSRNSAEGSSPEATAKSSASSGHVRVEGMADVLVEFFADVADLLQYARSIDVYRVGLDLQLRSRLGGRAAPEQPLLETGPGLRRTARRGWS